MKEIDDYGKGRRSVIIEMQAFLTKEAQKIKDLGKAKDSHVSATLSGHMKAFSKVNQKLTVKLNNLKARKDEK